MIRHWGLDALTKWSVKKGSENSCTISASHQRPPPPKKKKKIQQINATAD